MANMGYCRFGNTETDLEECLEALGNQESLSIEELNAARRMITSVVDYLREFDVIAGKSDSGINVYEEINSLFNDYEENNCKDN